MARTYKRDKNGRFAGGGGSSKKPAKKTQQRGTNRIRRDNAGKIQGIGGTGATGRGGRLRTAKGNKRATVTMQAKGVTPRAAIKGKVRRDPGAMAKAGQARARPAQSKGKQLRMYRELERALHKQRGIVSTGLSRAMGSTNQALAARGSAEAKKAIGRVDRIKANMRRLSGTQEGQAMPKPARIMFRGRAMGEKRGGETGKRGEYRGGGRVSIRPGRALDVVKAPRIGSTVKAKRPASAASAATGSRSIKQAKRAQRSRREFVLDRGRTGLRNNPRIKRLDTGMRQLSLTGPSKTLFRYKPVGRRRR